MGSIVSVGRHFTAEQLVSHTMFEALSRGLSTFTRVPALYPDTKPNAAHHYLAWLEETLVAQGGCDAKY